MRRALAIAGCGMLGVGLSACESTEQESAKIGRENEAAARDAATPPAHTHPLTRSHGHGHASAGSTSGKGSTTR